MPESVKKSLGIFAYIALAAGTTAVFWQVHSFEFINYDDASYVAANTHVLSGITSENVIWAFTAGHSGNWHPLTWLSLMLDCQLFGSNPGRIHLTNLLLHLANTLLLFAVLKKMTGLLWPSAFVAAAFALHPMHVESVAWIAERKDVLSGLFWMLTMLAYASYAKRPSLFRYMITLLMFAFGLMAKPMLVTLPFILLLMDYWPLNRFAVFGHVEIREHEGRESTAVPSKRAVFKDILIEKIPFLALAAISSIITYLVQQSAGAVVGSSALDLAGRIANAAMSYVKYISKLFWPQNLTIFYPFNLGGLEFRQVALSIFLLFVVSVLVIRFGKKYKYLPIGWFWFVGTLIPVIGLVQVGEQAMADRYTYIPYIGLFIIIAWGLRELAARWPHRKIALGASMFIVLAALGMCTYSQVSYWKNSITVFSHAIEVTQNNHLAHYNLGVALYKQGENSLALEHYKKALEILPKYESAAFAMGTLLAEQNDLNKAVEYFQKAVQLKPDSPRDHNYLAVALVKLGRLDEAAAHFTRAMQLKPDWVEPMNNLAGLILTHPEIKGHDINEAIHLAHRICELNKYKDPALLGNLAMAYAAAGKFPEAVDTAQKASKLADTVNRPEVKSRLQYHLTFYTQGKPYVESAPSSISNP